MRWGFPIRIVKARSKVQRTVKGGETQSGDPIVLVIVLHHAASRSRADDCHHCSKCIRSRGRSRTARGSPTENCPGAGVAVPAGAKTIDGKGKWVTPGFINAATQLGVREIDLVPSTVDTSARGERAVAAAFRVWDGINPASPLWAPARNEGITGVVVLPAGGLVSGQAAFVDTAAAGSSSRDIVRKAPVAMVAQLGAPPLGE